MLFGHKDKIELFKDIVKKDNLNHAYLFYGDPQIGKFLFAKGLAYFLEYGEFIFNGEKPLIDTVFVKPGENNKIGINEVRDIKLYINQKPLNSSKRLVVVDNSELLTPEAQNGFLKFLEEPADHIVFIFISNNPESLLSTVTSRLTRVYFKRLPEDNIVEILNDKLNIGRKKAENISKVSFGRIGRAIDIARGNDYQSDDQGLERYTEAKILNLYLKDKIGNSGKIAKLMEKEVQLKRYNLNEKLQKKAVDEIIKSNN